MLSKNQAMDIGDCARRIAHLAFNISEAQELGSGPGRRGEPWSKTYQRSAVEIYSETLTTNYQLNVARHFRSAASIMRDSPPRR